MRSGWAAVAVALVLVAALGSEAALDTARDVDVGLQPLLRSLTDFPTWDPDALGGDSQIGFAIAGKVIVLAVSLFLLAMVAGRTGSAGVALLAGWGAFVLASALAGAVFYLVAELMVFEGDLADAEGSALAPLVRAVNGGAVFALYTGPLIGTAVALARRREPAAASEPSTAEPFPPGVGVLHPTDPTSPPSGPAAPPLPRRVGAPASSEPFPPPPPPPPPPPGDVRPPAPTPVATWPPTPATGTVPPSPAWSPPEGQRPLPAAPLPRRGVGSRPVPSLPADPSESLDATEEQAPEKDR
jgi:hypothetical protein